MIGEACRQIAAWCTESGIDLVLTVRRGDWQLTLKHGLAGDQLTIANGKALWRRRPRQRQVNLDQQRGIGVRLAIGDFGAHRSAFTELIGLDIDQVMVGQQALANSPGEAVAAALLRALGMLCRALHSELCARPISTEHDLGLVAAFGCGRGQGADLCPPTSRGEMAGLVAATVLPPDSELLRKAQ